MKLNSLFTTLIPGRPERPAGQPGNNGEAGAFKQVLALFQKQPSKENAATPVRKPQLFSVAASSALKGAVKSKTAVLSIVKNAMASSKAKSSKTDKAKGPTATHPEVDTIPGEPKSVSAELLARIRTTKGRIIPKRSGINPEEDEAKRLANAHEHSPSPGGGLLRPVAVEGGKALGKAHGVISLLLARVKSHGENQKSPVGDKQNYNNAAVLTRLDERTSRVVKVFARQTAKSRLSFASTEALPQNTLPSSKQIFGVDQQRAAGKTSASMIAKSIHSALFSQSVKSFGQSHSLNAVSRSSLSDKEGTTRLSQQLSDFVSASRRPVSSSEPVQASDTGVDAPADRHGVKSRAAGLTDGKVPPREFIVDKNDFGAKSKLEAGLPKESVQSSGKTRTANATPIAQKLEPSVHVRNNRVNMEPVSAAKEPVSKTEKHADANRRITADAPKTGVPVEQRRAVNRDSRSIPQDRAQSAKRVQGDAARNTGSQRTTIEFPGTEVPGNSHVGRKAEKAEAATGSTRQSVETAGKGVTEGKADPSLANVWKAKILAAGRRVAKVLTEMGSIHRVQQPPRTESAKGINDRGPEASPGALSLSDLQEVILGLKTENRSSAQKLEANRESSAIKSRVRLIKDSSTKQVVSASIPRSVQSNSQFLKVHTEASGSAKSDPPEPTQTKRVQSASLPAPTDKAPNTPGEGNISRRSFWGVIFGQKQADRAKSPATPVRNNSALNENLTIAEPQPSNRATIKTDAPHSAQLLQSKGRTTRSAAIEAEVSQSVSKSELNARPEVSSHRTVAPSESGQEPARSFWGMRFGKSISEPITQANRTAQSESLGAQASLTGKSVASWKEGEIKSSSRGGENSSSVSAKSPNTSEQTPPPKSRTSPAKSKISHESLLPGRKSEEPVVTRAVDRGQSESQPPAGKTTPVPTGKSPGASEAPQSNTTIIPKHGASEIAPADGPRLPRRSTAKAAPETTRVNSKTVPAKAKDPVKTESQARIESVEEPESSLIAKTGVPRNEVQLLKANKNTLPATNETPAKLAHKADLHKYSQGWRPELANGPARDIPPPSRGNGSAQSVAAFASKKPGTSSSGEQAAEEESAPQQQGFNSQNTSQEARAATTAQRTEFPAFSPRFSAEQIRELQTLVQKALVSSRAAVSRGQEAVFNWRQKDFGSLRFSISTRNQGVSVTIQADRSEVAEAIDKSRAVVERMITDQGLRIERFDVQLRTSPDPQSRADQFAERQNQTADQAAEQRDQRSTPNCQTTQDIEDSPTARPRLTGDREWVA